MFSVVFVAAGLSSRMGEVNKLLVPVEGVSMVRRCVSVYVSLGMSVTVVLGFEAGKVGAALAGLDVSIAENPDYEDGQQGSVGVGLEAIAEPGEGLLIALADQPFLTEADLAAYCDAFLAGARDKIMVPYFERARGNPVLFPAGCVERMLAEAGAFECRKFIGAHPELVSEYKAPNAHFTTDIDTQGDLARLLAAGTPGQ